MQVTNYGTVSRRVSFSDNERGFSMGEIIIVEVIIAVLTAIAATGANQNQ